ncbi:MAG: hypothetical protein EOO61_00475 [Hymenobacter sp.]|nr:MAG: hypothetical protein EOO61_00475 [Hymenobacter sp.]
MVRSIKGQGTVTKWLMTKRAIVNKRHFVRYISIEENIFNIYKIINNKPPLTVQLVSFSSCYDFGEQTLSILSFIKYVGEPSSWIIYSDGTHTNDQIELLENTFKFIQVLKVAFDEEYIRYNIKPSLLPYKKEFIDYANSFPLGKKLFFYLNFRINKPTIFLDSDVLFYEKACCLYSLLKEKTAGWFLPDSEWGNLDSRYVAKTNAQHYQVNSGLFVVNFELKNMSQALNFFVDINDSYEYFSEQTILHILLLSNDFIPLDPRLFVLNSGDQFDLSYLYHKEQIAARHYTGPVRHKMWQRNWKWHLSL